MHNNIDALDDRASYRNITSLHAKIYLGDIEIADCVIKDFSDSGMRLYKPLKIWIPAVFTLKSSSFPNPIKVQRVWENSEHIGVKYI